jgi:peptidyl-prolyl cis-trans isomerase C
MTGPRLRRTGGTLWAATLLVSAACSRPPAGGGAAASPQTPAPSAASSADPNAPLPSPLPEVAARVNGRPIPTLRVRLIAEDALRRRTFEPGQRGLAYRTALNQFVTRELLAAETVARGLKADDKRVEAAYNEARVPYKDDVAWKTFLAERAMDDATFRQELRVKLTIEALLAQEVAGLPAPTDAELRAVYDKNPSGFEIKEQLRVAHIQLLVPAGGAEKTKAETRARADGLLKRLRAGEDFGRIARAESQDEGSRAKGGELPPFARGQLPKPFEDAAFSLKPGELSGVVDSPTGLHIIRLIERTPPRKLSFEEAREDLRGRVGQQRQQERILALVERLKAQARIETFL